MKEIFVNDETIKIVEEKAKFLSFGVEKKETTIPVHLIKLVQKAYNSSEGTASLAIILETEDEFFISYDELEDIDYVFNQIIDLKERKKCFRVELYNIETKETIDK